MKNQLKDTWATAKAVFKSLEELVEASSLVVVCAFTGYGAFHYVTNQNIQKVLFFATAVIALRAAVTWLDYLKRHAKDEKTFKDKSRK